MEPGAVQRYVLDNFRGYVRGVSPTRFKGFGLSDEYYPLSESLDEAGTHNVSQGIARATPLGDLTQFLGTSRVEQFPLSIGGNSAYGMQPYRFQAFSNVYHWVPPVGGDWIFVVVGGTPYYLTRGYEATSYVSASWTSRMRFNEVVDGLDQWTRMAQSQTWDFGCFEPFGRSLYYCDGVRPPLRITLSPSGTPWASLMGISHYEGADFLGQVEKPVRAISAMAGTSNRYAVVSQTIYGDSSASTFQVRLPSGLGTLDYEGNRGGISPVLQIDWARLDDAVTNLLIYRTGSEDSIYRLVGSVPRGQTVFVDSKPDDELGLPLTLDNGRPTTFRILRAWNDQMFGVGGYGRRNRLAVSRAFQPDVWPPQYTIDTGMIGEGESITQLWVIQGALYVFCSTKTYRLTGFRAEDYALEEVSAFIGCSSPESMATYQDGVVFKSVDGVYRFNGTFTKLSDPIDAYLPHASAFPDARMVGLVSGDLYVLSFLNHRVQSAASGDYPTTLFICDLRTGQWTCDEGSYAPLAACPFRNKESLTLGYQPYNGVAGTLTYLTLALFSEDFPNDDIRGYGFRVPLQNLDFELPDVTKRLVKVEVWYEALREHALVMKAYREHPQIEDEETTYAVTKSETSSWAPTNQTVADTMFYPQNVAAWNALYSADKPTTSLRVYRAIFSFQKIQAKSFSIDLTIDLDLNVKAGPFRVQKMIFHHVSESEQPSYYVPDPPGYIG